MSNVVFLKLRSNIIIPSDILLAERECKSFFCELVQVNNYRDVEPTLPLGKENVVRFTRDSFPIGFLGTNCLSNLHELVTSLSFIQEVWLSEENELARSLKNEYWIKRIKTLEGNFVCAIPLMTIAEILTYYNSSEITENDLKEIVECLSSGKNAEQMQFKKAVLKRITSTPHVHGLHRYKAKFFPRMIRSFITSNRKRLCANSSGKILLVDPFVGSGTALVESMLLGIESVGIDIDLLSVAISQAKINLMQIDMSKLRQAVEKTISNYNSHVEPSIEPNYSFPPWIAKKFVRLKTSQEQEKYEREITLWQKAISGTDSDEAQQILRVCLSDAITRKFNIRMMGTGVGRFALEIRKQELSTIMKANLGNLVHLASLVQVLKCVYNLKFQPSTVVHGTATNTHLPNESASIILTSPPYLPASSGRENYLVGKSISITTLGLMTPDEIREMETKSIGSMRNNNNVDISGLPNDVYQLYDWLNADELRKIKAKPSVAYYRELKNALLETHRILVQGGLAVYVIGRESVFYRFKTREILHKVACDKIFQEIAEQCGFIVDYRVDVQLDKKNSNARPRSLDAFYETVFVLKKPIYSLRKLLTHR